MLCWTLARHWRSCWAFNRAALRIFKRIVLPLPLLEEPFSHFQVKIVSFMYSLSFMSIGSTVFMLLSSTINYPVGPPQPWDFMDRKGRIRPFSLSTRSFHFPLDCFFIHLLIIFCSYPFIVKSKIDQRIIWKFTLFV